MDRTGVLSLAALGLAAYAVYTALYVPAMLIGPPVPLLLVAFLFQIVSAIVAAVGIWTRQGWAPIAIAIFGASIAAAQLIEVLLGVLPYMRALLVAVLAIVGALLLAAYVRRPPAHDAGTPLAAR